MSDKLLPCPFCGGEARIMLEEEDMPDNSFHNVYCMNCGAQFWVNSKSEAIKAWNNRTQPNEPLTLSELLEMDCKPVYCVDARGVGAWAIVSATFEECIDGEYGGWEFYSYGWADSDAGWLAYRNKLEQEEQL